MSTSKELGRPLRERSESREGMREHERAQKERVQKSLEEGRERHTEQAGRVVWAIETMMRLRFLYRYGYDTVWSLSYGAGLGHERQAM